MNELASMNRESGLQKSLNKAQITMIGLGGSIGTGLFMGSSIAIHSAGPAVLISYLIAGFVAVVMVLSLSEMAVVHPTAGSFGTYAELYISPWAGFVVRYTYWAAVMIAVGGEGVAAGVYMTYWFPTTPVWLWSVGFALLLLYVNSRSVANFGAFEYWFALIKVAAIIVFIILGMAAIFGIGQTPVGLHNLTGLPGGFMPHGFSGVWMGVLIGLFSFAGIELIAVVAGETKEPEKAIPAALRTMVVRLLLFYVLALAVIVTFAPWTQTGASVVAQSPFVKVFEHSGIRTAAGIMNFVVISAALSSMNANVYTGSRMMFSLSRGGCAPRGLGKLSAEGTPVAATLVSGIFFTISAGLSIVTPLAYNYILGVSAFSLVVVWSLILISHMRFRRVHKAEDLSVRMPFFPVPQIIGLLLLGAILVTMILDAHVWRISVMVGVPWIILVSIAYFIWRSKNAGQANLLK